MYIKTEPIPMVYKKRNLIIGIESPNDELFLRHFIQKALDGANHDDYIEEEISFGENLLKLIIDSSTEGDGISKELLFGDRVKILRKRNNMNQKELSIASGITQATISRIESGQVNELRSANLSRLAKALGVSIDCLLGDIETLIGDMK